MLWFILLLHSLPVKKKILCDERKVKEFLFDAFSQIFSFSFFFFFFLLFLLEIGSQFFKTDFFTGLSVKTQEFNQKCQLTLRRLPA